MCQDLTPERRDELIEHVAHQVTKYGMTTPALFFLEMNRPLSFIGSQGLLLLQPILGLFANETLISEFSLLLEDKSNIDRLLARLEELNKER